MGGPIPIRMRCSSNCQLQRFIKGVQSQSSTAHFTNACHSSSLHSLCGTVPSRGCSSTSTGSSCAGACSSSVCSTACQPQHPHHVPDAHQCNGRRPGVACTVAATDTLTASHLTSDLPAPHLATDSALLTDTQPSEQHHSTSLGDTMHCSSAAAPHASGHATFGGAMGLIADDLAAALLASAPDELRVHFASALLCGSNSGSGSNNTNSSSGGSSSSSSSSNTSNTSSSSSAAGPTDDLLSALIRNGPAELWSHFAASTSPPAADVTSNLLSHGSQELMSHFAAGPSVMEDPISSLIANGPDELRWHFAASSSSVTTDSASVTMSSSPDDAASQSASSSLPFQRDMTAFLIANGPEELKAHFGVSPLPLQHDVVSSMVMDGPEELRAHLGTTSHPSTHDVAAFLTSSGPGELRSHFLGASPPNMGDLTSSLLANGPGELIPHFRALTSTPAFSTHQPAPLSTAVHTTTPNLLLPSLPQPPPPHPNLHIPSSSSPAANDITTEAAAAEPHHPAWLQRTELLVGSQGLAKLRATRVLLVGLGGVGSFAAEFLCRAGIGHMTIVDGDTVDLTNKNRQLPALDSTVGQPKTQVVAARLRDISPDLDLTVVQDFLSPEAAEQLASSGQFDYVVDCIDSITPKKYLIVAAHKAGVKIISSMGAGGRMDSLAVQVCDLAHTYNDPFAANIRRSLAKEYGIREGVTVVFSPELSQRSSLALTARSEQKTFKRSYYGTISYIPATFGLQISAYIVNDVVDGPMKATVEKLFKASKAAHAARQSKANGKSAVGRKGNGRKRVKGGSEGAGVQRAVHRSDDEQSGMGTSVNVGAKVTGHSVHGHKAGSVTLSQAVLEGDGFEGFGI